MMHIEPLSLFHQELLESKFRSLNLFLAEYSFANLYLFRHLHRYEVITYEKELFIKGITRDQVPFIMLTSDPAQLSPQVLQVVFSLASILFPIPEAWLSSFKNFILQTSFKEEDSDYLFSSFKLAHFPGRHLSNKRNLVNQLFAQHQINSDNLSHHLEEAKQIVEHWHQEPKNVAIKTDYLACQEAIEYFHPLHLHGRIIYVDQQPAAFSIGEWITPTCYVVHFSKASSTIKGLYQYLHQELAQSIEETCGWINLEQDLGIPTLRHAKHSYLPDQLLHKWRLQLSFI